MKKLFLILAVCAAAFAACTPKIEVAGRVHVEGNQFVDPQGFPIIFRGLCFSDPVKLERPGHHELLRTEGHILHGMVLRSAVGSDAHRGLDLHPYHPGNILQGLSAEQLKKEPG